MILKLHPGLINLIFSTRHKNLNSVFLWVEAKQKNSTFFTRTPFICTVQITNLSPIRREFAPGFVPYKNGLRLTRFTRDKVCQLPAQGRWFSPGTPTSSTSKIDRHDVTEILLKVALNPNQTNKHFYAISANKIKTITNIE